MAGTQNAPKKHHYVPQGYLKNFTDAQGQLHGYSKRRGRGFYPASPRDVAFEADFHTLADRADPTALEPRLSLQFEAPLLHTINQVIRRVRLQQAGLPSAPLVSATEKRQLAQAVALQRVRTRPVRDEIDQVADEYWTPDHPLTREEFIRRSHLELLEQYMDDGFQQLTNVIDRNLVFMTTTRDRPFHTSDHPVTVSRGGKDGAAFWGGIGLGERNLELFFPLSSDVTAVFVGEHLHGRFAQVTAIRPESVPGRNAVTFANAHQLVLAAEPIVPADIKGRPLEQAQT